MNKNIKSPNNITRIQELEAQLKDINIVNCKQSLLISSLEELLLTIKEVLEYLELKIYFAKLINIRRIELFKLIRGVYVEAFTNNDLINSVLFDTLITQSYWLFGIKAADYVMNLNCHLKRDIKMISSKDFYIPFASQIGVSLD